MNIMDQSRIEFRFSGFGGQGLLLASIILAEALVNDGFQVIQGESHGIEARGGASRGEVIASREDIYDLAVSKPDIFVAISQEACTRYHAQNRKDALVILDSFQVREIPELDTQNAYAFPFTKLLKEKLNTVLPANICFLGNLVGLLPLVSVESLRTAILHRVPKGTEELNLKAYELGIELARGAKPLGK